MTLRLPAVLVAVALLLTCSRRQDPQAVLDHARQTFRNGDLVATTEEAEMGYRRFHELDAAWGWKFRLLEADALERRGMSERILSIFGSEPSPPPPDLLLEKLRLEAAAQASLNHLKEAQVLLEKADRLCAASQSSSCANVLAAHAWLEMHRGHFDIAQVFFERNLASSRALGDRFLEANALLNLSWSALQQEHFDDSLGWASAAYQQATVIGATSIEQVAMGNEGWAYYKLGESEKALGLFLEATNRARRLGATADEVKWLTTAGYVYLDAHDYGKAQQSYQQALDLAKQINSQEDILNALMSLALVCERLGNLDQARDYANQTIALTPPDGNRLDVLYPMLVKGHVAAQQHDTVEAERVFLEIERDPKSHVFLKWEVEHSLAQLYEGENKPAAAEQAYRAALSTFEAARSSLKHEESALPFPANASGIYDDYIHFLISQGASSKALQVAEYQRGRTLAEGLGLLQRGTTFKPDPVDVQAIARRAGGTILFYWLGEKQSYLWAINDHNTTLFTLPPRSEIDRRVQRYRKAVADQEEFLETATADGRALYQMLVAPAHTMLGKNARVFVIPDGMLNTLNFETLLVPGPLPDSAVHYWIEDVMITDASSLRLLAASRHGDKPTGRLLLLGDAVSPSADYPELRKASTEMESIEKHFPSAQRHVFARAGATPTAYLTSTPGQFSYIHFVAHGTASLLSPLDSAIVLSKASAQDDSFKLYARDIIRQPLRAELITISTCSGAGTRFYSGEGLVGLSWAFLRAGAHNVIGALWEVSDASTPQLMDELYRELKTGQTPSSALRAAKFSLLHSNSAFRKPFYWAPFQLYTGS
jgi:CHAT domain-containing protein